MHRRLFAALVLATPLCLLAAPARAQGALQSDAAVIAVTPAAVALATEVVAPAPRLAVGAEVAAMAASSKREGAILMIVGGAAIITGLLIDEPIVYVPGAVIGLYGLYRYLKAGGDI